jgi:hypothetical protein
MMNPHATKNLSSVRTQAKMFESSPEFNPKLRKSTHDHLQTPIETSVSSFAHGKTLKQIKEVESANPTNQHVLSACSNAKPARGDRKISIFVG